MVIREDTLIEGIELFKNFLVVAERRGGQNHLRVMHKDGSEHYMEFESETYDTWTSINPEFDSEVLRYGYTSNDYSNFRFRLQHGNQRKDFVKATRNYWRIQ